MDKFPIGRIVPFGMGLIVLSMFALTQIEADTSYGLLISVLFVMGLGTGGTMRPLFTSALRTLTHHEVARGSTLLNISQQIASSIGVAVISVMLTSQLRSSDLALPAIAAQRDPAIADQLGGPTVVTQGLAEAANAFANTYWLAAILVTLTLIPMGFLPRKREETAPATAEEPAPVGLH